MSVPRIYFAEERLLFATAMERAFADVVELLLAGGPTLRWPVTCRGEPAEMHHGVERSLIVFLRAALGPWITEETEIEIDHRRPEVGDHYDLQLVMRWPRFSSSQQHYQSVEVGCVYRLSRRRIAESRGAR